MSQQKKAIWHEQEYSGSAGNVITSVLLGKADAGAAFLIELEKEPEDIRNQIRTVLETPKMAPHPLSAHPRVPLPLQVAVTKAILALASERDGAELLKTLRLASPMAADYGRDYEALEEVDVRGLSNWGK